MNKEELFERELNKKTNISVLKTPIERQEYQKAEELIDKALEAEFGRRQAWKNFGLTEEEVCGKAQIKFPDCYGTPFMKQFHEWADKAHAIKDGLLKDEPYHIEIPYIDDDIWKQWYEKVQNIFPSDANARTLAKKWLEAKTAERNLNKSMRSATDAYSALSKEEDEKLDSKFYNLYRMTRR